MLKITVKNPNTSSYQLTYAVYMMAASLFGSAVCTNKLVENRLRMYYSELDANRQVRLEDKVLALTEHQLSPMLTSMGLAPDDMSVKVRFQNGPAFDTIVLSNERLILTITCLPDRRRKDDCSLGISVTDRLTGRQVNDVLNPISRSRRQKEAPEK